MAVSVVFCSGCLCCRVVVCASVPVVKRQPVPGGRVKFPEDGYAKIYTRKPVKVSVYVNADDRGHDTTRSSPTPEPVKFSASFVFCVGRLRA